MKKAILLLLICFYTLSTLGVSLKEFYCCGKLKSVSLTFAKHTKDNCSMGDDSDDCCETLFQFFKVKDKHLAADLHTTPAKHFVALHPLMPDNKEIFLSTQTIYFFNGIHGPPVHYGVPIYISNCVFRV